MGWRVQLGWRAQALAAELGFGNVVLEGSLEHAVKYLVVGDAHGRASEPRALEAVEEPGMELVGIECQAYGQKQLLAWLRRGLTAYGSAADKACWGHFAAACRLAELALQWRGGQV